MCKTYSGNDITINLWKECIIVPTKFNRDLLTPPFAITVVAFTNLKPFVFAGKTHSLHKT